jgi:hypothetical protein
LAFKAAFNGFRSAFKSKPEQYGCKAAIWQSTMGTNFLGALFASSSAGPNRGAPMPNPVAPRRLYAKPQRESFILKSMLVASAPFFGALVMANEEFYLSAPGQSLSEAEAMLRLPAR